MVVESNARSMKPNCLSLQSWFQMQIDRLVNGPPTVPPNVCRFRNGVALVSLLILETLYGSVAMFRCSFTNCLGMGMALFLDFCRVQSVSISTCRSMSAIIFLWVLELFPRMVCNNLRELTVAEIRLVVHKCQKYAPNFDVYSWRAPSFQPCTAYEFMHPSTTQWPYSAPASSPCKATMAVIVWTMCLLAATTSTIYDSAETGYAHMVSV